MVDGRSPTPARKNRGPAHPLGPRRSGQEFKGAAYWLPLEGQSRPALLMARPWADRPNDARRLLGTASGDSALPRAGRRLLSTPLKPGRSLTLAAILISFCGVCVERGPSRGLVSRSRRSRVVAWHMLLGRLRALRRAVGGLLLRRPL